MNERHRRICGHHPRVKGDGRLACVGKCVFGLGRPFIGQSHGDLLLQEQLHTLDLGVGVEPRHHRLPF